MIETNSAERQAQLRMLKEWENHINKISVGAAHVSVENDQDLDGPPSHMTYITECKPAPGIEIPDDPPMGCECKPGTCGIRTERSCCPSFIGHMFPYTKFGRLRIQVGTPIYECNKRCMCGPDCSNRVVQKGQRVKLAIFKTSNGCGWGVKAMENIKRGTFVVEYVGEIITNEEAERRGEFYDSTGQTYLFDLDCNLGEKNLYTVDAANFGNVSHFINHSCDPNLAIYNVWINCLDPNLPKLCLFALRDIIKGEEMTFDYKQETGQANSPSKRLKLSPEKSIGVTECMCGTNACRKVVF